MKTNKIWKEERRYKIALEIMCDFINGRNIRECNLNDLFEGVVKCWIVIDEKENLENFMKYLGSHIEHSERSVELKDYKNKLKKVKSLLDIISDEN